MGKLYKHLFLICSIFLSQVGCLGQTNNHVFIYDKEGNEIAFNEIDSIVHIELVSDISNAKRNEILDELACIADYTMFPDSSYRFVVNQGYASQFKTKAFSNNYVVYCQNEYRDSLNDVVWGTNRILVKMNPENPINTLLQLLNIPDIQYESKWYDSTIYTLIIPKDSNIFTLSNRIYESGLVEYAQPSFSRYTKLDGYETNSYFNEQWNLRDTTITYDTWDNTPIYYNGINALRAWKFTTGSPDIKVAILDNGVEGTHEDLFNNFLMEWNYTGYSISSMENPKEHGTCCAGIISAANNNVGVVGIAHGCKIASFITHCKIRTNSNNRSDVNPPDNPIYYNDEMVADAIYYACDSIRIHVFSCSWSRKYYVEEILKSAINHATRYGRNGKGCIFVFSSGNKNNEWETDIIRPTAVLPNVLSVGGTTQTGYRVSQNLPDGEGVPEWESCFGDSLDLMAPGEVVWTTCNVSDSCYYEDFDGTSAAAPHVAGVAALILSMDTNLTYRQVFEILCSSATKVRSDYYFYSDNPSYPYGTWNNEMGYGLVNAHHAILKTLYRDYYMTGTSEIGLCETGSYHVHGTTPFNDSITCGWSSSSNIEILSTTDSLVARGTRPGPGWVAFNIIHDNDSLPQVFPVNVTNGGITILSNHEFTGNITLSSPHFTDADLIIDSLATLTITDTLYIAGGSRLIVRPGGKLIVNGGTLTNACDGEMWQGIIVEGNPNLPQYAQLQGSVILNNATIENARNAISTRGADTNAVYEHTGGIVQATNTLFRNNRRSAEFLEYENHYGSNVTDNTSRFTRCTFTVDDDNLFASNGTSFLEHVSMWRVRGVKFNGCDFRNETTGSSTRGAGILSIEAGFTAKRVCPQLSNSDPCGCYNSGSDTVRRCSFTGFSEAVHAANTLGAYDITLDNCDFAYNTAGVSLYAADNARVSFCDFALGDSLSVLGLQLSRSSGFIVEGNTFHKHSKHYPYPTGILCDSTGTAENIIRLNSFTGLYTACNAVGTNGAIPRVSPSGLQYQCNSYNGNTCDIFVSSSSRIRSYQGSSSQGADNSFARTLTSSLYLSSGSLRYYYSTGTGHALLGDHPGVTEYSASPNACGSTLCGVQGGGGGGSGLGPKGAPALAQYRALGEEYADIVETCHGASPQTDAPDPQYETDNAALSARLSDLSAAMGDLARTEIRNILCDSVPDMVLLKQWYAAIVETCHGASLQDSTIPVSAYQLAEVYSQEGDLATAAALLAALPQQFSPNEDARAEYANYMALQQLRETVAGYGDAMNLQGDAMNRVSTNWYLMTDTDIAAMQQVAENGGRAARMAKEILCFFHHICYEDDMALNLGDIGERNLSGGHAQDRRTRCIPTDNGLAIYPNPADGTLTVESASPIREITVYDLSGRVMMTANGGIVETCHGASLQMDVSSLQGGIYLLRVVTASGVETGRFVKN